MFCRFCRGACPAKGVRGKQPPQGGGGKAKQTRGWAGAGRPRPAARSAARGKPRNGGGGRGGRGRGTGGIPPAPRGPAPEPAKAARKSTPKLARQCCAVWVCRVSRPAAFCGLPYFPLVGYCLVGFWWISFGNSTAVLPYRVFPFRTDNQREG